MATTGKRKYGRTQRKEVTEHRELHNEQLRNLKSSPALQLSNQGR
jgi:hypothetical protein